jgi:GDP/UDP-N,N'-diacetylbacillosamine 2-epimerase (hydrolysing)
MAYVSGVIGNSSSGLLEAPSLRVGTVNVGDRQRGRIQAESVISCEPTQREIRDAIMELLSVEFGNKVQKVVSPFGKGGASSKIVNNVMKANLNDINIKKFIDLKTSNENVSNVR